MAYIPVAERVAHVMDDPQHWQNFLGLVRTGIPFGLACKAVRVSRQAMDTYLDSRPERAAEYIDAELEATEVIEQVLYEEARARQKWAVTMWLERRDKERWAPSAQEGPRRLVLDPASLKGMIDGTAPAAALERGSITDAVQVVDGEVAPVNDEGAPVAATPADVPAVEIPAVDPGAAPAPF